MKKCFFLLLIILISVGSDLSFAQQSPTRNPFYLFHRLDESDGLSNNVINDIIQDGIGFIWIATEDGLFRYDGIDFKTYRYHPEDSLTLPNNAVQKLFIDDEGAIWVLTDYGIGVYNSKNDNFHRISPGQNNTQLPHRSITSISRFGENSLIIGSFGAGIFQEKKGAYTIVNPLSDPDGVNLNQQVVSDLRFDKDSILWIGTWNDGLLLYDFKFNEVKKALFKDGQSYRVFCINVLSDNSVWVGTNIGLLVYRDFNSTPEHFDKTRTPWLPDNDVLSIFEDEVGIVWIGTRGGGMVSLNRRINLENGNIDYTIYSPSPYYNSISHRTISKIFKDSFGNMWLGTHNAGINIFDPNGEVVRTFTHIPNLPSLSHQSVWGICEGDNNTIWAGTDGGGVNLVNPYNQEINRIQSQNFSDRAILCALKDSKNNIWFGTYSGGVNIYNPRTKSVKIINSLNGLVNNDVRSLFEDSEGRIWIGTNGSGLHLFDPKNEICKQVPSTNYMDIRGIVAGDDSTLWFATFGLGLVNFNTITNSLKIYNWYKEGEQTPVALTLHRDGDNIWVGTRQSGMLLFNTKTELFTPLVNTNNSGSTVRAIVQDKSNRIWYSTNEGVVCYDKQAQKDYYFTSADGFQVGQFNDGSGILLSTGDIAFGGIHGISVFSPRDLLVADKAPSVVFTEILMFESKKTEEQVTGLLLNSSSNVTLKYNQNNLSIRYTALSFPNASKWVYSYILEGYQERWIEKENLRVLTFRNLPPGKYVLRLKSSDISGFTTSTTTILPITILPPFWKTIPAYIGYLITFILSIILLVRYNVKRISLKQKLLFEQQLRKQEQEAIEQKIRFFTNFSHELRSPLTLIQGPVDELIADSSLSAKQPLLQIVKRNTTILTRLVNRLLEFRKLESETTMLSVGYYNVSELMAEESEGFRYRASQMGLQIVQNIEYDLYAWVDIEKLRIVINNLLANALKFTPSGGEVGVELKTYDSSLILKVLDTGRGIDVKDMDSIFSPFFQADNSAGMGGTGIGLSLAKSFVELHFGSIKVESNKHTGTTFTVIVPRDIRSLCEKNNKIRIIETGNEVQKNDYQCESEDSLELENRKVILVVDDNKDIRRYLNHLLGKDYTVITADNGSKGLEIAIKEIPDIIISDIMMPEVDGIEMCKQIKKSDKTNHIPLIFLTAKEADAVKIEGYHSGADAYITKPFSPTLLTTRIENLLAQRKRINDFYLSTDWHNLDKKDTPDERFLFQAKETIIALMRDNDVSVYDLASQLGYSRTSLYRKIKAITGMSINQFIRKVKLNYAAHLLSFEDVTVSEVAFSIGFNDLKYFRNCFKEIYGILPSEYQKNHQEKN